MQQLIIQTNAILFREKIKYFRASSMIKAVPVATILSTKTLKLNKIRTKCIW